MPKTGYDTSVPYITAKACKPEDRDFQIKKPTTAKPQFTKSGLSED